MGCTSSKKAHRGPPPYTRSKSLPAHRLGASRRGSDAEIMMKRANDTTPRVNKGNGVADTTRVAEKGIAADEPETINAWELMEGLDEPVAGPAGSSWMRNAPGDSIVSDFDPVVISAFRKAMDRLSPNHPLLLDVSDTKKRMGPPNGERKVVCYVTSMRGVRRTYDECSDVMRILRGYGVWVDERDVMLHRGFKDELSEVLGADGFDPTRLPSVFANCEYLGGADEVRRMHDDGALARAVERCEAVGLGVCEACGDMRFVPCETCSGSHKVFADDDEGDDTGSGFRPCSGSGFRPCSGCNENGLVRCRVCC